MRVTCEPMVSATCGKSGLPSTNPGCPGSSGYIPSAAHTYQDDISPRSSLPASPSGESLYIWVSIRRTVACALVGAPTKSYIHGAPKDGSLPMKAYGADG